MPGETIRGKVLPMWEVISLILVVLCIALFRSRQNWKNRAELGMDLSYRAADGLNQYRDMLVQYAGWLRSQMVYFKRNPQVCRTFYECAVKLEEVTGIDSAVSEFDLPEDRD